MMLFDWRRALFGQILGFKQPFPNIAVHLNEFYGHSSQSAPALRMPLSKKAREVFGDSLRTDGRQSPDESFIWIYNL